MNNKFFLWIFASVLSITLCAASAMADIAKPDAYQSLTAVELQSGSTPRLHGGISDLAGNERRYAERLPVQLSGAIKKVKGSKYKPSKRAHPVKNHGAKRKNLRS